jgi:hypothetical protein
MLKRLSLIKIMLSIFFLVVIFRLVLIMFVEHEAYLAGQKVSRFKKKKFLQKEEIFMTERVGN